MKKERQNNIFYKGLGDMLFRSLIKYAFTYLWGHRIYMYNDED